MAWILARVECGFLINPKEEVLMIDATARGLSNGTTLVKRAAK